MSYKDYELESKQIQDENGKLLTGFAEWIFNWFFPRKAMWSSTASAKETVASLKKFYKYLAEKNIVEISDYKFLLALIKQDMPEWLEHYKDEYEW